MSKVLYRYEIEYRSEDGDTSIHLRELPVIRETEKCYFISRNYYEILGKGYGEKRVRKDAHNTYAFDTKLKAKEHFIRRTHKRIRWFEFWTEECEKALKLIEDEKV
jgi:hypothetical protein